VPASAIEQGIARLECVPGRFQLVSGGQDDVRVVVDYAHTDDALKNLLETARPLTQGRLVTVFGCGGDRDRSKRPLMGAVAARLSDFVVLTSDNPRSESPDRILEEITRGLSPVAEPGAPERATVPFTSQVDRRKAIDYAVRTAKPGDLVIIAGKGHEKYQIIGDRTLPFDDVDIARAALGQRRAASRV
jgi:UDP-N-acetylmuramoyl-L-alanyl-D-glutamate--2,6-diaminopimelate ligase